MIRSLKYPPALSPPPNTAISSLFFVSFSTGKQRATCPARGVRLSLVLTIVQVNVPEEDKKFYGKNLYTYLLDSSMAT